MTTTAATGPSTVYTGRTTNWPILIPTTLLAVLLLAGGFTGEGTDASEAAVVTTIVALGILANVLTAASVRASAGPNGFDVRWGFVGWPRCHYPLDRIARAEVIDLPWYRVTFGLRWSPRGTSCTVRSGPTVRLTLTNRRTVTISVPDPELAVRAIDAARTG